MQNAFGWLAQFGPFGMIAVIVAIIAAFGLAAFYAARQRTKSMKELAETLGFQFFPTVPMVEIERLPRFKLLTSGRRQTAINMLRGSTDSTQVMIFDWSYVTGSGKHAQTHHVTVVAIQSSEWDLPAVHCRPETVLDWIGLTFDGRDIDFEDRPVFSKRYHLHGNLEKEIRKLFDFEVCAFLEQHQGMYVEAHREWLIYYQADRAVKPQKLQERFNEAFQFHLLLKAAASADESMADASRSAIADEPRDEMSSESEREF